MSAGRTDSASTLVAASPGEVFDAFARPETLMAWLPPGNMTGRALEYDFRTGGRYRIELTYAGDAPTGVGKTTAHTDISAGQFIAVEPGKRIVQSVEFETADPALGGQMIIRWSLEPASPGARVGTRVTVTAENVPSGISQADHDAGLRASLENLARYLRAR